MVSYWAAKGLSSGAVRVPGMATRWQLYTRAVCLVLTQNVAWLALVRPFRGYCVGATAQRWWGEGEKEDRRRGLKVKVMSLSTTVGGL